MAKFETMTLPTEPDAKAPDGSQVRVLLRLDAGSMAHFQLEPGQTSKAVAHRSVEELWYLLSGRGEMWRSQRGHSEVVSLSEGCCMSIPAGTSFQFRCLDDEPLCALAVTMPPWPGEDEASLVHGAWPTAAGP